MSGCAKIDWSCRGRSRSEERSGSGRSRSGNGAGNRAGAVGCGAGNGAGTEGRGAGSGSHRIRFEREREILPLSIRSHAVVMTMLFIGSL